MEFQKNLISKNKQDVLTSMVIKTMSKQTISFGKAPAVMSMTDSVIAKKSAENAVVAAQATEGTSSKNDESKKEENEAKQQSQEAEQPKKTSNSRKYIIDKCPHTTRKYYAKGMCNHCYHHFGRPNLATKCIHKDRMNFAKNMCLGCYQKNKFLMKKLKHQQQKKADSDAKFQAENQDLSADKSGEGTKHETPVMVSADQIQNQ